MDTVADTLTRIRNANMIRKDDVVVAKSKVVDAILKIMKEEGFIKNYREEEHGYVIELLYDGSRPVITDLQKISKGGQRIYVGWREMRPVLGGRGLGIISTSQGVMSQEQAKAKKIGGEYICKIW